MAVVSGPAVVVDANGQLGIALSSARYKKDITPMGSRSEKVLDLRPVTFAYKDDARAITHYGLIAEEVATVYPDLVTRTASGEVQTVKYQELIPMIQHAFIPGGPRSEGMNTIPRVILVRCWYSD